MAVGLTILLLLGSHVASADEASVSCSADGGQSDTVPTSRKRRALLEQSFLQQNAVKHAAATVAFEEAPNASRVVGSLTPGGGHVNKSDAKHMVHTKSIGTWISRTIGSDVFGDALEPTESGEELKAEHHSQSDGHDHGSQNVILFLFGTLVAGSCMLMVIERHAPLVQWPCALFAGGIALSMAHHGFNNSGEWKYLVWPSWFDSIERWSALNPHLLFYTFLPALIFGEAMKMNVNLFTKCFWQVLLLAVPGLLLGTFLTACFGRFVLPYGWDWPIALVFGSMLSATDPVAVVALFKSLGVSPKLNMIISGESLLNDGSAICVFVLMLKVSLGAHVGAYDVALFFSHMMFTSVVVGVCLGMCAVTLIGLCSEEHQRSDAMIQFVITICCGYLAFFLAENELSTSGVLATVTAGLVTAYCAWPRFVSRETIHIVWEALDFIANTIIFFLSGVLFGNICISRHHLIEYSDVGWLLVLYVALHLIRVFTITLFWIPLNLVGSPLRWQEGVMMAWSGLRGAIGLALAIIVDMEPGISTLRGSRIMFHMGGIATLTMLVNAMSSSRVLQVLGLTKMSHTKERMITHVDKLMAEDTRKSFEEMLENSDGLSRDLIAKMVPALQKPIAPTPEDAASKAEPALRRQPTLDSCASLMSWLEVEDEERALLQMYREVFLRVVQHYYWEAIEEGILPRTMSITRVLLHSTDAALDATSVSLQDWDEIEKHTDAVLNPGLIARLLSDWSMAPGFYKISWLRRTFSNQVHRSRLVYIASCFEEAHSRAREKVPHYFGGQQDVLISQVQKQVDAESREECQKAAALLRHVPGDAVQLAKCKMVARKLLQRQLKRVGELQETGLLNEFEAAHLNRQVVQAFRELLHRPQAAWFEESIESAVR